MLDGRQRHRRRRLRVAAVVAVLAAGVTLWYAVPAVQQHPCEGWTAPVLQWSGQCDQQFQRVTMGDAHEAIGRYLTAAGGPDPASAWAMMGPEAQAGLNEGAFVAQWADVALAERTQTFRRTANRFNWFTFTYRVYRTPERDDAGQPAWDSPRGTTQEFRGRMQLRYSPSGVIVADVAKSDPTGPSAARSYAWAVFQDETVARAEPSDDAPHSGPVVQAGSGVRALCELSTSGGRWYASHLGWFPAESVDLSEVPGDGVLACGAH